MKNKIIRRALSPEIIIQQNRLFIKKKRCYDVQSELVIDSSIIYFKFYFDIVFISKNQNI